MIANLAGERKSFFAPWLWAIAFLFMLNASVAAQATANVKDNTAFSVIVSTDENEQAPVQRWTSLNLCVDQFIRKQLALPPAKDQATAAATAPATAISEHSQQTSGASFQFVADHRGRVEQILAYGPEQVLATNFSNPILVQHLRSKNVPVTVLQEPTSLAQALALQAHLRALLQLNARPQLSASPQLSAGESLAFADLSTNHMLYQQRVVWLQPNHYSFGSETLFDELLQALGAENLGAVKGSGLVRFTLDDVLTLQPDVILLEAAEDDPFSLADSYLAHRALQRYMQRSDVQVLRVPREVMGCLAYELESFVQMLEPRYSFSSAASQVNNPQGRTNQ